MVGNLVFVMGRGGASFHSADSALSRGRGGMFQVIPGPCPCGAHPHSFPGWGPICYHLFLTGTHLGYGWGGGLSGDRGREFQKDTPPPAVEWGGAGKKAIGPRFARPRPSRNEL